MSKTLIAYYSRSGGNYVSGNIVDLPVGNTEIIAQTICGLTGASLFKIEQAKPYSPAYNECVRQAQADLRANARPALLKKPDSLEPFDTIILAYPNFCGTMPMAVFTFLEAFDFSGKSILPLCTHEGSGMGKSESDLRRLCPQAKLRPGLAVKGSNVKNARETVRQWLESIAAGQHE